MKIQPILPVVGVVVLGSLLVMLLQRSPEPQTAAPTSRTSTPVSPPQPAVLHQAGQEQGEAAPVVDAATGQSLGAESPAKPAIVVRTDVRPQPNREVSIGLVLAGPDGQNLPITSVVHSQQPPGLRIISEAGQVVAQGNFAYGWGGTCRYTWRVPNDFTGKFQVQVDIDLGGAEARHERPWHTL